MTEFKLSASLKGHEDDVRGVAFPAPDCVVSASRDATVRVWRRTGQAPPEYDESIASHGSAFVNSVAFVPSSPDFPHGLIVSGGQDTIIDVRQPGKTPEADADRLLIGHQGNVCALDVSRDPDKRFLVSGSWDSSAKVWDIAKGESTATLKGHELSVWGVLAYDAEHIITACADKAIRVFSPTGKLVRTIHGSSDVVRALCKLPANNSFGAHFASAGNDAVITLWTLEGKAISQLYGHENFIYALAALPTGELVSSSEDRTVRVWRDGECIQTITHPAISVWCLAVCAENGDIVTGASDRIVRVFSRSKERHAAAEAIEKFEDSIKQSSIPKQAMPDIDRSALPTPDFLQRKSGTKDGQIQMVQEHNGTIGAYQWSTSNNEWISVGTVVDAAGGGSQRQQYMGKDYDYVFDVDIEDGAPPLKLPYNRSDNAYEVAQKFIADNELPSSYVDQVVNFILRNTEGATLGQTPADGPRASLQGTSTERGRNYQSVSRRKIIPQKEYLKITSASFAVIRKKIEELNQELISSGRKAMCFSPGDLQTMQSLMKQLESAMSNPTTSPILSTGITLCVRIVTEWPPQNRIPGLDLLRCLAAATPSIAKPELNILQIIQDSGAIASERASQNTTMLAARLLANLFAHEQGRDLALNRFQDIRAMVRPSLLPQSGANRNVQIAVTTLYINYAVLLNDAGNTRSAKQALLADLALLLGDPAVVDSETHYRALVAVGTLLSPQEDRTKLLEELEGGPAVLVGAIERLAEVTKEPRIKDCAEEVTALV